jgi:hypothetical protein
MSYVKDAEMRAILANMCECYERKGGIEVNSFISDLEGANLKDLVSKAVFDVAGYEEDELESLFLDYVRHVERRSIKEQAKGITERMLEAEKRGDEKQIMELLEEKRRVLAFMKMNQ